MSNFLLTIAFIIFFLMAPLAMCIDSGKEADKNIASQKEAKLSDQEKSKPNAPKKVAAKDKDEVKEALLALFGRK